jgi:hypothetical protein
MTAYSVFQACVVGVIVVACLFSAIRRLAPKTSTKARTRLGAWMGKTSHPAWMRAWGGKLVVVQNAAGGCDSGCSTCGSCGPSNDAKVHTITIQHQHR